MVVVHRITLRPTEEQRAELRDLGLTLPSGIALPGGGAPYVAFDVEESHRNWATLKERFREWGAGDLVSTRFSVEEVAAAKWLEFIPEWHHGYPQPEREFGFLDITYDLTDWCAACGVGLQQKAPFQMKGEPKWGRRGILQLNWIFDEFFVTPGVWSAVFEPRGVACRVVTNLKRETLRTVVQLVVDQKVGIETEGLAGERCGKCGRMKYLPATRGAFPAVTTEPLGAIARTLEAFGSGASAHNGVIISQDLARAISAGNVRGASVRPVGGST